MVIVSYLILGKLKAVVYSAQILVLGSSGYILIFLKISSKEYMPLC